MFQQADGSIRRPTKLNSDLRRPPANLRTINTLHCLSYKKCVCVAYVVQCVRSAGKHVHTIQCTIHNTLAVHIKYQCSEVHTV